MDRSRSKLCVEHGCTVHASFGYRVDADGNRGRRLYCRKHKKDDMVNLAANECRHPDCTKIASYNYIGETSKAYCSEHKKAFMVRTHYNRCRYSDDGGNRCKTHANYAYETDTRAKYCSSHKLYGMVYKTKSVILCNHEGCTTVASFNYPGCKDRRFCSVHKEDGMICLSKSKLCIVDGCNIVASYGTVGGKMKYCSKHGSDNTVYLRDKNRTKCKYRPMMHLASISPVCTKNALYGHPSDRLRMYCEDHKEDGMILINNRPVCSHEGCTVTPSFNYEDQKIRLYCSKHKLEGMIDLTQRPALCTVDDCINTAEYNRITYKTPRYCIDHKTDDMIPIVRPVRVLKNVNRKKRKRQN